MKKGDEELDSSSKLLVIFIKFLNHILSWKNKNQKSMKGQFCNNGQKMSTCIHIIQFL